MKIEKLSGTNAFIAVDLAEAECSTGVVRSAPKILQGGAKNMARTTTYTFAIRELKIGGASGAVNAEAADAPEAIATFVEEIKPRVEGGSLALDAGKGITPEAFSEFAAVDTRNAVRNETVNGFVLSTYLDALGAVAAAQGALGSLEGMTAAVEAGPLSDALRAILTERGVTSISESLGDQVDMVFCGSRQGMIDGDVAISLSTKVLVPTGPHALSAKGFAVLRRRNIIALPDFVTTAGATFAGWPAGDATPEAVITDAETTIEGVIKEVMTHEEGPLMAACYKAEAFLGSWLTELPYGRPLA